MAAYLSQVIPFPRVRRLSHLWNSPFGRENQKEVFCEEARIHQARLAQERPSQLQIYWSQGLRRVRTG
jgi:hypothetical protein